jgi:hypothetical protein
MLVLGMAMDRRQLIDGTSTAEGSAVGRGHVSLSTNLDTGHSKPFISIGILSYILEQTV